MSTSEKMILKHKKRQNLLIATPFLAFFINQLLLTSDITSKHGSGYQFCIEDSIYLSSLFFILVATTFLSLSVLIKKSKYYSLIPALFLVCGSDISFFFYLKNEFKDYNYGNGTKAPELGIFNVVLFSAKAIVIIPGLVRYKYNITAFYFLLNCLSLSTIGILQLLDQNDDQNGW